MTTFLTTVKLLLSLVVVLLVAQVSAPLVQERSSFKEVFVQFPPKEVKVHLNEAELDEKIAEFHKEVKHANEETMACIQRMNGHDEVVQQVDHYTKRILAVVVRAYRNRAYSKTNWHRRVPNILKRVSSLGSHDIKIEDDILNCHLLFVKFNLIPLLQDINSSQNDIVKLSHEVRHDSKTVIRSYYESVKKEQTIYAIMDFFDGKTMDLEKKKNELANHIVPFVKSIFWGYDGAIDYITTQYEKHCKDPEGVVQQFASYYIKVWWSSVALIPNTDLNNWALWDAFMATACPLPAHSPFDPNTFKSAPKEKILQFPSDGEPLEFVDFKREIAVPEQMKELRPHLTMIKNSFKNSDLIGQLGANFSEYKVLSEDDRKTHNENLWIGYQKKLIILETIVRVVAEDSEKAVEYLENPEKEFIKWHSHWSTKEGPIPKQIVHKVDRALHRSNYFKNQDNAVALQKKVILKNVLTFLFGKRVQFKPPKKSEIDTDFKDVDLVVPKEIKMFYTFSRSHMIKYSEVMDKVVVHFSLMSLLGDEKPGRGFNVEAWALLVLAIVPDLEKILKESIQVVSDANSQDVTNKSCCGTALNWVSENKCLTGVIVAFIIGIPSIIAISLMGSESQTTATEETLPRTWSTKIPATGDQAFLIKFVWFVVGAMIVAMIIVWVCGMIRKKRESQNSKTSKTNGARKNKKGRQASATSTGYNRGTPTSATKGTPTGSSTKATPTSTPTIVSKNKPSTSPFLEAWLGQSLTPSKPTTKPPPISTSNPGPVSQMKVAPSPSKVSKNSPSSQVPKSKAPLGKTKSPKDTTTTKPGEPGKGDQKKMKK